MILAAARERLSPLVLVAIIIAMLLAGTAGALVYRACLLAAGGAVFVDNTVSQLSRTGDETLLLKLETPELLDKQNPENKQALASLRAQLGPFQHYLGATGTVDKLALLRFAASASYVAKARFTNGIATFYLAVVRRHGQWMIAGFHIEGLVLGPPPGASLLPFVPLQPAR